MRNTKNIFIRVHALPGEQAVLRVLCTLLVATVAMYAYFVILSITNVIAHKEAITQSERLQSEVGLLEQEYFQLSKLVTPEAAHALGLSPTTNTSFVRRPGAVGVAEGNKGL